MHILLTNDDGIFAPGLAAMYQYLRDLGKITVVAPSDVRSGTSHSISLGEVDCTQVDVVGKFKGYSVEGSPADCVNLALNQLVPRDEPVDLVVSGINHGANVGIHVFYSGTVAGAIEGAFYGLPGIAVSAAVDEPMDFAKAADYAGRVIRRLLPVPAGKVISINIPRLSEGRPKGVRVVRQSTIGHEEFLPPPEKGGPAFHASRNKKIPGAQNREDGIDTKALFDGYITVTALRDDLTDAAENERLKTLKFEM
jgi:5'-nucleotidase